MLNRFLELLTGEACRPIPTDMDAPIAERGAGRTIVAFSFGGSKIKAVTAKLNSKGVPTFSEPVYHSHTQYRGGDESRAAISQFIARFADKAKAKDAVILVQGGWLTNTIEVAYRSSDLERNQLIRNQPREIIMSAPMVDTMYYSVAHPFRDRSICFSFPNSLLEEAIDPVAAADLNIMRVGSGCCALLSKITNERFDEAFGGGRPSAPIDRNRQGSGRDLLIVDEVASLLIFEQDGDWVEIGSKNDPDISPVDAANNLIGRRTDSSKPISFVSTLGPDFEARLKDITQDVMPLHNLYPASTKGLISRVPEFDAILTD